MAIFNTSSKPKPQRRTGHSFGEDSTEDAAEWAAGINYLPVDEATAAARPATIEKGYHEAECEALGEEQKPLWSAEGRKAARPATVDMASLGEDYNVSMHVITVQKDVLAEAKANLDQHNQVLEGRTRREPKAKFFYLLRWVVFLVGDIAGISGAAIMRGEIPALAVMLALSAGMATVTAGLVGREIRDVQMARRRALHPPNLPPEHEKFAWLFNNRGEGEKLGRIMVLGGVTAALVALGIWALRTDAEGSLSGIVYGSIAVAIALASGINSYCYADEIADMLERAHDKYLKEVKTLKKLGKDRVLADHDGAKAEADSILLECEQRGTAGSLRYTAMMNGVSRNNPAIFGHGYAPPTKRQFHESDFSIFETDLDGEETANGAKP